MLVAVGKMLPIRFVYNRSKNEMATLKDIGGSVFENGAK